MERLASQVELLLVARSISFRRVYAIGNNQVKISLGSKGSILIYRNEGTLYCRDQNGQVFEFKKTSPYFSNIPNHMIDTNIIESPTTGKLKEIYGKKDDLLKKGDLLFVIESMKMETQIRAPFDLRINIINCKFGDSLQYKQVMAQVERL